VVWGNSASTSKSLSLSDGAVGDVQ